jgi:hypothetical protein
MIDIDNIFMSTGNITTTNNVERKIINNIDFLSTTLSKDVNKETSLPYDEYIQNQLPFILCAMRKQHLKIFNLEGEIINKSTNNGYISFKSLDLFL